MRAAPAAICPTSSSSSLKHTTCGGDSRPPFRHQSGRDPWAEQRVEARRRERHESCTAPAMALLTQNSTLIQDSTQTTWTPSELAVRKVRQEHGSFWRLVYQHALSSWRVAAHRVRNRLIRQFLEMAQRLEHMEACAIAREEAARMGRRPWVLGAPLPTPLLPHTGAVSYRDAQRNARKSFRL